MNGPAPEPFRETIVADARSRAAVVPGLNEEPLRVLREHLQELVAEPVPRLPHRAKPALLVTSEAPGYGKSHLLSRVFHELRGQASVIYVQPFQNAATPFHSLVLALVRELHFPDRDGGGCWNRDEPSQLDLLAHAVLAHTLADLIEGAADSFKISAEPGSAELLRREPLETFNRGKDPWAHWLLEYWPKLEEVFEPALARRGLEIRHVDSWLRVLRTYAFSPFENITRRLCIEWMCGQPIDGEEAQRIGLRAADAISGDITAEESNRLCRERLHDLCELSAFFRPFIFCFDQTEVYGGSPLLARAFGMLVASLVNDFRGHLIVVTANQKPWNERIYDHFEVADQQRFNQPPLLLEGLNRAQAAELVRLRMAEVGIPAERAQEFLAKPWFAEIYPSQTSQWGARTFLQKCQAAWSGIDEKVDIATLFRERRDRILANPKRHLFEPDTLQWLIEIAADGLPGIEVKSSLEKYTDIEWVTAERTCCFGFLSGFNHNRWAAVARHSQARAERENGRAKFVFFRAPGQPRIPGEKWKVRPEIERAQASSLQFFNLTLEELATLYAPRDLFADAAQGDIPFSPEEVIAFIQQDLAPLWERFAAAIESPAPAPQPAREESELPAPGPLTEEVRAIVERARFLSVDEVLSWLGRSELTRESVLAAAGFCPDIRLYTHPKMTVLQWQPRA